MQETEAWRWESDVYSSVKARIWGIEDTLVGEFVRPSAYKIFIKYLGFW